MIEIFKGSRKRNDPVDLSYASFQIKPTGIGFLFKDHNGEPLRLKHKCTLIVEGDLHYKYEALDEELCIVVNKKTRVVSGIFFV